MRVRTLDLADGDFSDLQALERMIGDARIVSLGEATHGDGATFRARARLVRFHHQGMGFDVSAWEAGFRDLPRAWALVEEGAPVMSAMRRGMSRVWSRSARIAPASHGSVGAWVHPVRRRQGALEGTCRDAKEGTFGC